MKSKGVMLATVAALALAGCQSPVSRDEMARSVGDIDKLNETAKGIGKNDTLYLGSRSVAATARVPSLPAAWSQPGRVIINSGGAALSLQELATLIGGQLNASVRIEDAMQGGGAPTAGGTAVSGMPLVTGKRMTVPQILNQMATWFGVAWRYEDGEIIVSRYTQRTYTVAALATAAEVEGSVSTTGMESFSAGSSASSGSSSGSGSGGTDIAKAVTKYKAKLDPAADLKAALDDLIGGDGRVSVSAALGTVTVVARPGVQKRVEQYVKDVNGIMTRQVRIAVQVLSVSDNAGLDYGLDVSLALEKLGAIALTGATPASASATVSGSGNLAVSVVSGVAEGSSAVVKALESIGKVKLSTDAQVLALNGRPAPLVVARQKPYLVGSTTTVYDSGVVQSTEIGNLVLGLAMQVLPRILNDQELLLHFNVRMTDLNEMGEFTSSGNTYQQPDVNLRAFTQETKVRSGDTIVLSGFKSSDERASDSGWPGIVKYVGGLLGGSTSDSKSKTSIVLLLTPYVEAGS